MACDNDEDDVNPEENSALDNNEDGSDDNDDEINYDNDNPSDSDDDLVSLHMYINSTDMNTYTYTFCRKKESLIPSICWHNLYCLPLKYFIILV